MAPPAGTQATDYNSSTPELMSSPQLKESVSHEQTSLLFSNIPSTIVATFIIAPYIMYINWGINGQSTMLIWGFYMALTMAYRFAIYALYNKKGPLERNQTWNRLFLFGIVLTAIGWGIAGSIFLQSGELQQHMFTTVILAGLSAGALATLTPFYSAYVLFTLINMLPLMITLLIFGTPTHYTMAMLILVFMTFIITTSIKMKNSIHDAISLRFQHDDALKNVAQQKQKTDELNLNLRQQINERKIIEQHLEHSMSQLKATLESATDGILVIDNNEQVTNFNQSFIELFNIPQTLLEIADFSQIQRHISAHLKDKSQISTINTTDFSLLELDDGRLIEVFSKPQKIADNIIGNVLSYRDATMRIKSESSLQEAKLKAESANKEKSDFLSRVSHELRTPLNAILGFGHLLKEDKLKHLDKDEHDYVAHICLAGEHLLHLIDDLLDISRIESGKLNINLSAVSCNEIVRDSMALVQATAAANNIDINFKNELSCSPIVHADLTRSKQALVNLLSNAIKYNDKNGSITLALCANETHVRFQVTDTGVGIPKESLSEIFQPFRRLKQTNKTKGTGIGLTITKRLIDVMNGSMGVESETGKGSTFWFELPIASDEDNIRNSQNITFEGHKARSIKNKHTIVYIEDEALNQALMKSIINKIPNTHLTLASTGEEGLELILSEQPDLILLDINLPGISGYDVLKIIKNESLFDNTPIFALSANAMPDEIQRGKDAGFFDYLIKPINIDNMRILLTDTLSQLEYQQTS